MWKDVLETYRCLISNRKNLPGMKMEDALNRSALESMERELEWLKGKAKEDGFEEE